MFIDEYYIIVTYNGARFQVDRTQRDYIVNQCMHITTENRFQHIGFTDLLGALVTLPISDISFIAQTNQEIRNNAGEYHKWQHKEQKRIESIVLDKENLDEDQPKYVM